MSILGQSFADFELIVVDDGSTDGTWEELQGMGQNLVAIKQLNLGPGYARNTGAAHSKGQYLAFLDSDDLWFPWTLAVYAEALNKFDEPEFIVGKPLRFCTATILDGCENSGAEFNHFPDYFASSEEWRWWGVSSFVVAKKAFNAVGGFTSQDVNAEDADLALKLGTTRGFVQVTSPFTFAYREHDANLTLNRKKSVAGVSRLIQAEREGVYPGGKARQQERHEIITRHVRPVCLECSRSGMRKSALKLYFVTFFWHLGLGRFRFLLGFWIKFMMKST